MLVVERSPCVRTCGYFVRRAWKDYALVLTVLRLRGCMMTIGERVCLRCTPSIASARASAVTCCGFNQHRAKYLTSISNGVGYLSRGPMRAYLPRKVPNKANMPSFARLIHLHLASQGIEARNSLQIRHGINGEGWIRTIHHTIAGRRGHKVTMDRLCHLVHKLIEVRFRFSERYHGVLPVSCGTAYTDNGVAHGARRVNIVDVRSARNVLRNPVALELGGVFTPSKKSFYGLLGRKRRSHGEKIERR